MKIERHGKARTLNQAELELLFNQGLKTVRDRALFGVALFTAGRIQEVCSLFCSDVFAGRGEVRSHLTFRKAHTKGKLATRTIPISPDLRILLSDYSPEISGGYLFPGLNAQQHIHVDSASRVLKKACQRVGIDGASTHSFRRTALTQMSNAGIPLRVIQEISGHRNLEQLQRYLEVTDEQVLGAIVSLSIISPVGAGQTTFPDTQLPQPSSLIDS